MTVKKITYDTPKWFEEILKNPELKSLTFLRDHERAYRNVVLWQPYGVSTSPECLTAMKKFRRLGFQSIIIGGSLYHPLALSVILYRPEDADDAQQLITRIKKATLAGNHQYTKANKWGGVR
jgi:hypothetical protein